MLFGLRQIAAISVFAVVLLAGCQPVHPEVPAEEAGAQEFPATPSLPDMFQPEGIAISSDGTAYVGSIATGAIYQIDLRTGEGKMLVEAQEEQGIGGLAYDERTGLLYATGIGYGNAFVYDAATGELVQEVQFVEEGGLVNDVTITDHAVYFSDSFKPVIYKLSLNADGQLSEPLETSTISLSGEYEYIEGGLNANGIVAMHGGEYLIIALTDSGRLYRVDPVSGAATLIELDSDVLIYHDGLVADGDTLYVINYNNRVYVVQMEPDGVSGKLIRAVTDPNFDAITTAARYGDSLYVVNARWDTDLTPETPYWITRIDRSPAWSITTAPAEEQIANAMGAAPNMVAKDATILGFPVNEDDDMVVLREGSNGWTCLTDWPVSPDNDPVCYDPVFSAWNDAYMAGTDPEINGPGIAYMLGGGSDPSNSDPMAMEPAPGEKWIASMPHVMLIIPGGFDPAVFSTDPHSGFPFIMWQGTPYEHLMIPVVAQGSLTTKPLASTASVEEQIQNMKGAAPTAIIADATLMGYPTEEGGEMVVLQEGTNGWVCYPDGQASPRNDPSCNDAITEAGFSSGTTRKVPQPGISYMLSGGSDASNFVPDASEPAPGEDWVTTPSHIMLMVPGGFDVSSFSTDHMTAYPYIMFDDTDYEHLMIPLVDIAEGQEISHDQHEGTLLSVNPAGGENTFVSIEEALAYAAAEYAPEERVTIEVAPGDYVGPFTIDRPNTALIALSEPQYDAKGYLIGFGSPVNITIEEDLAKAANIIDIRADNVTVSGFSIDGGSFKTDDLNGGIGINVITPNVHLRGFLITDNIVENMGDTALYTHQASGTVARNRSTTPGFLGFNASGSSAGGDAEVVVEKNWFENKELGICMIASVWDSFERGDEFGPAGMVVYIRDNYLANSTPFFGMMAGHGLFFPAMMVRPYYNPANDVTLRGEITGNTIINSAGAAIVVKPGHTEEGGGSFDTTLMLDNNTFEGNASIAEITFNTDEGYVLDSSITLVDIDQAIPSIDVEAADLGAAELNNEIQISNVAP